MRVKAGSIMMWRSCLLHGVAPNLAPSVRKHLYIAYTPRWVRPTAPDATMLLDPELLEGASPIRKQLLGGMGDGSHPLGDNAAINDGVSQHWFPTSEQKVPLKAWAEEHARKDEPMDWGAGGQGASWPPSFWRPTVGVDGGASALNYLPKDSPAYELFSPGDFSQGYSNFQASHHLRKPASFVSCSVCGRAHSGAGVAAQNLVMLPEFERIPDWDAISVPVRVASCSNISAFCAAFGLAPLTRFCGRRRPRLAVRWWTWRRSPPPLMARPWRTPRSCGGGCRS